MDTLLLVGSTDPKLSVLLSKMGYTIAPFEEGVSVGEQVQTHLVDLIVLDSRTTSFNGLKLCDELKEGNTTKGLPIIYIARSDTDQRILKEKRYTKIEILDTEFSFGEVAAKIATQLRIRKLVGRDSKSKPNLSEVNASLRDLNDRFKKDLDDARAIQLALLPSSLPKGEGFEVAATYAPLDEVGGDWYYAKVEPSGKISLQISDVTGHGLSAAFIGCMTKLAVNAAAIEPPNEVLKEINRLMTPQLPPGRFVTMNALLFDPKSGLLDIASAGHPPALVLNRKTKQVQQLKGDGFPIGFFDEGDYSLQQTTLEKGDVVVILTDGVTEARNRGKQFYGMDRMIAKLLASDPLVTADVLVKDLLKDFDDFMDGRRLRDDVTILLLKRL